MQNNKLTKISLGTFDLVKGVSMIVVITAHMLPHYNLTEFSLLTPVNSIIMLLSFSVMPALFIISGFSFKEKSVNAMLKKTFSDLIRPYIFVGISIVIIYPIIVFLRSRWWPYAIQETLRFLLAYVLGVGKPGKRIFDFLIYECFVVWFLLALFVAQNTLNLILKLKQVSMQILAVSLCAIAGYVLSLIDFTYYCIPQGLLAVGYCYVGYLLKKYKILTSEKAPVWAYALLLIASIISHGFGEFHMSYLTYKHGLLDYLGAGCEGMILVFFGVYIAQCEWKALDWVRQAGIYSYWIMCIHAVELTCIPWQLLPEILSLPEWTVFLIEASMKVLIIILGCTMQKKVSKFVYKRRLRKNGQ